jgi:hypothetical protein
LAGFYDEIDLHWCWNGDFSLHNGDLRDTADDTLRSLVQELHTVAASALEDWELYPQLGASLDDFIGEPNNRRVGNAVHDRLLVSITSAGLVSEADLKINVIPVHANKALVVLTVNAIPTIANHLVDNQKIVVQLVFDLLEQGVFFLDQKPIISEGQY